MLSDLGTLPRIAEALIAALVSVLSGFGTDTSMISVTGCTATGADRRRLSSGALISYDVTFTTSSNASGADGSFLSSLS